MDTAVDETPNEGITTGGATMPNESEGNKKMPAKRKQKGQAPPPKRSKSAPRKKAPKKSAKVTGVTSEEEDDSGAAAVATERDDSAVASPADSEERKVGEIIPDPDAPLTRPEGQLARNPNMSDEDAVLAAKREYNRQNAARARSRSRNLVHDLQQTVYKLAADIANLKASNLKLRNKSDKLRADNRKIAQESLLAQAPLNSPLATSFHQELGESRQEIIPNASSLAALEMQAREEDLLRSIVAAQTQQQQQTLLQQPGLLTQSLVYPTATTVGGLRAPALSSLYPSAPWGGVVNALPNSSLTALRLTDPSQILALQQQGVDVSQLIQHMSSGTAAALGAGEAPATALMGLVGGGLPNDALTGLAMAQQQELQQTQGVNLGALGANLH
eukprot:CAMPEP_0172476718 /NCGR_PEP_ID=MMETSP1065-20121228/70521_1 /TAXON_ID=265537 /ORGANISM="Amphiprora paludosa, Strain CCMP125" /LENGTH=387 /DNA_ID=CAMNT_0013234947 /DNA_START=349 /DNA_END=1512 /DNA_ORIENTATION=+